MEIEIEIEDSLEDNYDRSIYQCYGIRISWRKPGAWEKLKEIVKESKESSSARTASGGLRNSSGNRTMDGKELPLHKKIIRDFITVPTYVVSGGLRWLGFVDIANKDAVGTVLEILRQEDLAQLSERIVREGLI